jgi:AcrR family transcriptional regulator
VDFAEVAAVRPAGSSRGSRAAATGTTPAQARIIAAALDLFARHGVGGTSLGMIAGAVGVTKAAIFHQFKTKDDIILAAAEAELGHLEAVLDAADAQPTRAEAREVLITGIVDLAVVRRQTVSVILSDPIIVGFFGSHEPFRRVMHRLSRLLSGDDPSPEAHVPTAMFSAAISGAVMHPLVRDLDDDTLRTQLLLLTRRFFDASA